MAGYIGTQAVSVNTTSATITGDASIGGDLSLGDSDKAIFGAGSDLQIYHDGSNSYVDDAGTGRLILRGNDRVMIQKYTGEDMISCLVDGAVKLYHNNAKKFETSASGITVLGNIANASGDMALDTAGDFIIDCAGSITLDSDGGDVQFKDGGVSIGAVINNNSDFVFRSLVSNKDVLIRGNNAGTPITALQLDMSDGGTAIFNNQIKVPNSSVAIGGTADNGFELMVTGGAKITNAGNDSHGQLRLTGTSSGDSELVMSTASNERHIYVDESDSNTLRFSGGNGKNHASDMKINNVGNLAVGGALSKGSGSFKIRHPLEAKKNTHYLVHSFIEGPQADNIYRGKVDLVSGSATQNIDTVAGMSDGTFAALNREVQCFTTNESGWTAIKGSVSGNVLTITAQEDSCTDTISWMVIGERKDPHMMSAHTDWTDSDGKIIIEPELTDGQKSENTEYDPDCGC